MKKNIFIAGSVVLAAIAVFVGYSYFSKTVMPATETNSLIQKGAKTQQPSSVTSSAGVDMSYTGDSVVYGDKVVKDGDIEYRSFVMNLPIGSNTVGAQGNLKYGGIENVNTHEKYVMLDASRLDSLDIFAVRGVVALVNKIYGNKYAGFYRVDLNKEKQLGNNVYFVNSFKDADSALDDTGVDLVFKDSVVMVRQDNISLYDILSGYEKILTKLNKGETFGYISCYDGQASVPEAVLDGNILKYSVYHDIDKSVDPCNLKQKRPLFNKSIILE